MNEHPPVMTNRRTWIQGAVAGVTGLAVGSLGTRAETGRGESPGSASPNRFPSSPPSARFCLNTSTIREAKLGLEALVDLTARVGYDAIEPWINEIEAYRARGGSLSDLRKRIGDAGLSVPSAIGFFDYLSDDPALRREGLETAKRSMELVAALGGTRIAAPPFRNTERADLSPQAAAERYAAVLEAGQGLGVTPMLEVWGFSRTFQRLGEAAHAAMETGHPDACILADVYHLRKGGSPFSTLGWLNGSKLPHFHINDYPAQPGPDGLADKDRVFPGDGVAPLSEIVRLLTDNGFDGFWSLELFNPEYWRRDPEAVAREGLEKTRKAVLGAV